MMDKTFMDIFSDDFFRPKEFELQKFIDDIGDLDSVTSMEIINKITFISKKDLVINSIKGLKNKNVSIVLGSKMHELCLQNDIKTNKYSNTDDLLRSLNNESIALIDKETYLYYKDKKLQNYNIIYENTLKDNYKFIMNASNETFNNVFSYYISTINYDSYKYRRYARKKKNERWRTR